MYCAEPQLTFRDVPYAAKLKETFERLSESFVAQSQNLRSADTAVLPRFSTGCQTGIDSLRLGIEDFLGPAKAALAPYLASGTWDRTAATSVAADHGPKAIAFLFSALQNRTGSVRLRAVQTLHALHVPEAEAALARVVESDTVLWVRVAAAEALGELPARDPAAFSCLAAASMADDSSLRAVATFALGKIQAPLDKVMPLLRERLNKDDEMGVRIYAAFALGRLGPVAEESLPDLYRFKRECPSESQGRKAAAAAIHSITFGERRHTGHPEK